jgi:D-xylose reductase
MDSDNSIVTPDKVPIRETWEALETTVDEKIVRSIGVSNFQAQSLYDILTYARHPLSALQIEHHPYLVQSDLVAMAQENKISVTAYSSFGPQSFLELPGVFNKRANDIKLLFDNEVVTGIAEKHGVTPAQVLLRWATQRYSFSFKTRTVILVIHVSPDPLQLFQNRIVPLVSSRT